MFDKRLKLGTYLGIGLYVHWSFALLLGYLAYNAREHGIAGMAFAIIVAVGMFTCVTLHEYGHAMAARRFGIPTIDITLLPIGGVARLERMPRIPWQELVVAVAGPAVNVVIGSLLAIGVALFAREPFVDFYQSLGELDPLTSPSIIGFLFFMLVANFVLVIFNMVPAFPMDGGRVFRSLLAMVTNYQNATYIASRVGLVCAALMGLLALMTSNPVTLMIALFIAYAGLSEARQVDVTESIRGLTIRDSMIHDAPAISMDMPLPEIARMWSGISFNELPVVSMAGIVVGVLRLSEVSKAIRKGVDLRTTAGQLADHGVMTARLSDSLESVMVGSARGNRTVPVVDDLHHLVGILDLPSIADRGRIANVARFAETPLSHQFDTMN